MNITPETKYIDFAPLEPYITEECAMQLRAAAIQEFGDYNSLTIEKFSELAQLTPDVAKKNYETVLGVYWLYGFHDFVVDFSKSVKNLSLQPTPMELSASSVCYETTMIESMLVFSRDYFGLKSFSEAAQTTLGDYLIARKDDYNRKAFERRLNEIQMQKIKAKQ